MHANPGRAHMHRANDGHVVDPNLDSCRWMPHTVKGIGLEPSVAHAAHEKDVCAFRRRRECVTRDKKRHGDLLACTILTMKILHEFIVQEYEFGVRS